MLERPNLLQLRKSIRKTESKNTPIPALTTKVKHSTNTNQTNVE